MKLEVIKEFSAVYTQDVFRVYVDGLMIDSFYSEDGAMRRCEDIKRAHQESKGSEVIYTEELFR